MRHITTYKLFESSLFKWKDVNNFIDTHIPDIWYDIDDYLNVDFNRGKVQIKTKQFNQDNRGSVSEDDLPTLFVNFLLSGKDGVDIASFNSKGERKHITSFSGQTVGTNVPIEVLKNHPCYNDLISAHNHTLSALDNPIYYVFMMEGSRDPWSSQTQNKDTIYVEIHYILINQFLQSIEFELNRHPHLIHPWKYLEPIKGLGLDEHPVVKTLKNMERDRKIRDKFKDTYRDLLNYGFNYSGVEDAKKLDVDKLIDAGCEGHDIFIWMLFTKKYEGVEYLRYFSYSWFFYQESSEWSNVGYNLLYPMFIHCLKRTEIFWDYDDNRVYDIATLYLVFKHDLLSHHLEDGDTRDLWMKVLSNTFNDVATNLIAYNRKDAMEWLYNLIVSEEPSEKDKKIIADFVERINRKISRIKPQITTGRIESGKFDVIPDYDYFKEIGDRYTEYIS